MALFVNFIIYQPLSSILNSFAYDYLVRRRVGGLHLSFFYLEETPIPARIAPTAFLFLAINAAALTFVHPMFSSQWMELKARFSELGEMPWQSCWAVTTHERLRRRCMIDAAVAELYGLSVEDMQFILTIDESDPIGFWRVDQELPVEQRLTSLTLKAFKHLKQVGLDEFCRRGWDLPDYARTFDRPGVKSWTSTEDWSDCERHARNILGDEGFTRFKTNLSAKESDQPGQASPHVAEPSPTYALGTPGAQRRLFPREPTLFGDPMEDPPTRTKRGR